VPMGHRGRRPGGVALLEELARPFLRDLTALRAEVEAEDMAPGAREEILRRLEALQAESFAVAAGADFPAALLRARAALRACRSRAPRVCHFGTSGPPRTPAAGECNSPLQVRGIVHDSVHDIPGINTAHLGTPPRASLPGAPAIFDFNVALVHPIVRISA